MLLISTFLFLRGTLGTQLLGAGGGGSGIHHKELGDGQYVEGTPQAGAGAAVGKCLTVRPVAWKKGGSPAMFHGGVPDTDPHPRKKKRIKEQRSKATVRAPRRSHTVRPVLQSMGKLFAAPSGWVPVGGNALASKHPN